MQYFNKPFKKIIKMNLQVGTILIAKDPCTMSHTKKDALIIGKEYPVTFVNEEDNRIMIDSEIYEDHVFIINNIENDYDGKDLSFYFDIKN